MFDVLAKVLKSVDGVYPPVFSFDDVEDWPEGELDRCVASGVLSPGRPARYLTCLECGETEEVLFVVDSATDKLHTYTRCAEVGPVEIPQQRLLQWEMSYEHLLDAVFANVTLSAGREEIVRDRVWRLGKTRWVGASRNVYFARGLHRRDAWQVINQTKFAERSVVFIPARLPDSRITGLPIVIPLTAVVCWDKNAIGFDVEYVEAEIVDRVARLDEKSKSEGTQRSSQRGSRLAVIQSLTREMKEHLRTARDHAFDTLDRTGTPQLLPRPQRELLARKLGIHKSSVTRAFTDEEAEELRFLWDLAADLDRIQYAGSPV